MQLLLLLFRTLVGLRLDGLASLVSYLVYVARRRATDRERHRVLRAMGIHGAWRASYGGVAEAARYLLLTGPRFNTFGFLARTRLPARPAFLVDAACAAAHADRWSLVFYDADSLRTLASLRGNADATGVVRVALPPDAAPSGVMVSARYYGVRAGCAAATFPRVWDEEGGDLLVPQAEIAYDADAEFAALRALPRVPLHDLLGWHVHWFVRHGAWLRALGGEAFLRGLVLPIGNPDTCFRFGALRAGQRVRFRLNDPSLRAGYTLHRRDSVPIAWGEVPPHGAVVEVDEDCVYVVRVVPRPAAATEARAFPRRNNHALPLLDPTAASPVVTRDRFADDVVTA